MSHKSESNPSVSTPPEITLKFKEILISNGITDSILEVTVKESGLKGENMASSTEYVTVNFGDPGKKPLHLFVKRPTQNEAYNQMLEDCQLFKKESQFFMEYLPVAKEYCKRVGREEFMNIYPKCYYGDDKLVVFENLVLDKGYVLLNKEEQQDFETAKFSLRSLAKHHAIGHAVIMEHGGPTALFERFPKLKYESFANETGRAMLAPSLDSAVDTNVKMLEKSGTEECATAIEKLKSLKGMQFDAIVDSVKTFPNDFLVLNHGDYWNNNMMFLKDKESERIVDHIAVDFQVVRYASPCVDLGYYLFTSVKSKIRREQIRELFIVYLDALKTFSNELGHPMHISLSDLEADFCKHFHFGFWMGLMVTTGGGYAVLKDIEISEVGGMEELRQNFDELIAKWIEKNPDKCKENVDKILDFVNDYQRFTSGAID